MVLASAFLDHAANHAVRHFADPSLAAASLRATPNRLRNNLKALGLLFESMVIRDLRVYAQAADAQVVHSISPM